MPSPSPSPVSSESDDEQTMNSKPPSPEPAIQNGNFQSPPETPMLPQDSSASLLYHGMSKEEDLPKNKPCSRDAEVRGLVVIYTDLSAVFLPLALLIFVSMVLYANGHVKDHYYDGFQNAITVVNSMVQKECLNVRA
ncbi:hypothetical protein QQX98_009601 [Neonectria punicea]|uniref:Uncharacterized protein n=1 Tax=Neonectria punicea TaxID=979145 RepID=A0ABR1GRY6_9HYPO